MEIEHLAFAQINFYLALVQYFFTVTFSKYLSIVITMQIKCCLEALGGWAGLTPLVHHLHLFILNCLRPILAKV